MSACVYVREAGDCLPRLVRLCYIRLLLVLPDTILGSSTDRRIKYNKEKAFKRDETNIIQARLKTESLAALKYNLGKQGTFTENFSRLAEHSGKTPGLETLGV